MKILVYNIRKQHALSRKQIEIISTILPKEYFIPIKTFHLTPESPGQERFEYSYELKEAYFEYIIDQKTNNSTEDALRNLLIGLCRIKAKSEFGYFVRKKEMDDYLPFVEKWLPVCFKAIQKRN